MIFQTHGTRTGRLSPVSLPISRCIYGWILRHLRDGENRGYHVYAQNGQWQFKQPGCNSCGLWPSFQPNYLTFPAVDPARHSSQTLMCSHRVTPGPWGDSGAADSAFRAVASMQQPKWQGLFLGGRLTLVHRTGFLPPGGF